jgi:hypothetical protein
MPCEIMKKFDESLMYIQDMISDSTTNNVQLYDLCKYLFEDRFLGVFSSDNRPTHIQNNYMYIMNTDSSKQKGVHWLACYKYKNKLFVFDSFGRDIQILSPFFKHSHMIDVIKTRNQSYGSNECGSRSITYLLLFDEYKIKFINAINNF